jgi:uroporphyrin-III C-methyltransferase / precorrin-2 dehydrogenase / sirohydrochlorin ferrochelatase
MRHFPIFLDLNGRRALVVGHGEAADRKAAALREAGAVVRAEPRYAPGLLDGVAIAICADAPEDDLAALFRDAVAEGIPVNVVDRPELCSYLTPAVVDRDPITVAVSSGGEAPVLARLLRARIEAAVPPAFARLGVIAGEFKERLRRRFPDTAARRRVLDAALTGQVAGLVFAGQEDAARRAFADAIDGAEAQPGIVHLVGAGPGAADLLTVRAHRLLGEADVIVHDRLVTDAVMAMARRDASRIYVGKARDNHCLKQHEINALLVRLAREGKKVVRLKGGDPLVFGRGGEEAEALAEAGVAFEIVPGVTAALACAAGAGIPLTHRDASRTVTFVTGHTKDGVVDLDWAALAKSGTLAVYMGVASLSRLFAGLVGAGFAADTPAALIERGGTDRQRVLIRTFDALVAEAPGWTEDGPAMLLLGDVVAHRVGAETENAAAAIADAA